MNKKRRIENGKWKKKKRNELEKNIITEFLIEIELKMWTQNIENLN